MAAKREHTDADKGERESAKIQNNWDKNGRREREGPSPEKENQKGYSRGQGKEKRPLCQWQGYYDHDAAAMQVAWQVKVLNWKWNLN